MLRADSYSPQGFQRRDVHLDAADLEAIASTLAGIDVQGARYPAALQSLVGR